MAGQKVRHRKRNGRKAAETLCTGMIAQVAALGWSFVRTVETMSVDELRAHIRAIDHLGSHAVAPDAVRFVRTILNGNWMPARRGNLPAIPTQRPSTAKSSNCPAFEHFN
jgi:hypothetical protein